MRMPDYELGPIRPVAEAESLILRVTRGCPWNRCAFCTSYKSKQIEFSARTAEEVKSDIARARELYGPDSFRTCFLQDGDVFCLPTKELADILHTVQELFPGVQEISCYGIVHQIAKKSSEEINILAEAGLSRVYCGMESGSDRVLRLIRKGANSEMLIRAGKNLMDAGIELSYFLVMGMGGEEHWEESALDSAKVLNEVNPDYIRVRSLRIKPGSELMEMYRKGVFRMSSEELMVREQRLLLENLTARSYYDNDHSMNLLMQLRGNLPESRNEMLACIDRYLALSEEEKRIFHYGVRIGGMRSLDDLENAGLRAAVSAKIPEVEAHFPDWKDKDILNCLRVLMTSS